MFCLIYTTVPDEKSGENISKHLLNKKLIACANLMPLGKSFYVWKGQIQNETEHVLLLKTTPDKFKEIKQNILNLHPYECPCIFEISTNQIHSPFLEWIKTEAH